MTIDDRTGRLEFSFRSVERSASLPAERNGFAAGSPVGGLPWGPLWGTWPLLGGGGERDNLNLQAGAGDHWRVSDQNLGPQQLNASCTSK